jgi:hypothetical protein
LPKHRRPASESTPCPDFQLAPLTTLSPGVLDGRDKLDRFILLLALAFNDLKALLWVGHQAKKCRTTPWKLDAKNGQAFGFGIFVSRQLLGLTHELLSEIETAQDQKLLNDPRFLTALEMIPAKARENWDAMTSVAESDEGRDPLRKYLLVARSTTIFHYDPKLLGRGYDIHFTGKVPAAPPESYEYAYVSLGEAMEDTRFYFADAAAGAVYTTVLDADDLLFRQADAMFERLNWALRFIVGAYLAVKQEGLNAATELTPK